MPEDTPSVPPEKPIVLDYSTIRGTMMVTIRRMRLIEAELAHAKLESEGIPAFIADANLATMHPLLMGEVQLQVPETDVQLAEEILSRPAAIDAEGEYADEDWRCPKCHRKEVDLLPLTRPWRWVRSGMIWAFISVILIGILQAIMDRDERRLIEPYLNPLLVFCLIAAPGLALSLLFARRILRCRSCSHEWRKGGRENLSQTP